jgi:hypothetical protein
MGMDGYIRIQVQIFFFSDLDMGTDSVKCVGYRYACYKHIIYLTLSIRS